MWKVGCWALEVGALQLEVERWMWKETVGWWMLQVRALRWWKLEVD